MIQAVIFDLDGVLVSTDHLHYLGWKMIADKEHIYFDKEINNRLRGISRMQSLEIILEHADRVYTETEKNELADAKNTYYTNLLKGLSPLDILPYGKEVLEDLKKKEIKVAIGSSSKNTKTILKQIGLFEAFDAIADGTDITRSKPYPDVFLKAAEKLGINPMNCAVVEDAFSGIEAAKNAGMFAVAISDAVKSPLADAKIGSLRDLLSVI